MKIVIDTNCLLQMVPKTAPCRSIFDAFLDGKISFCYTTDILEEYEEILQRFYPPFIADYTMKLLVNMPNAVFCTSYYKWNLIHSDPDDNKFVDCALNSGADFLVTNDRHFSILKQTYFPPVTVVDIDTLREILFEELE